MVPLPVKLDSRRLLVLDDLLAREIDESGQPSRHSFLRSVGAGGMEFRFCTAWDEKRLRYTAETALDFVRETGPDESLLLLDLMFEPPAADGRADFGRKLLPRLRAEFPGLPIVLMTTEKPEDAGREYLRLGAVDYLIKPIEERRFWRTVRRYAARDPRQWLLGQHDLYQGAVLTTASLAEAGRHFTVQGGTGEERAAFASFAARSAQRERVLALGVRELTEQALALRLFGRVFRSWETEVQPAAGSLLDEARGGLLRIDGVDALPRGLQSNLARFLATPAADAPAVLIAAETGGGLARLAQEDRFDRELFDLLNGSQPVNLPPPAICGEDLLLRLAVQHGSRTAAGDAFDRADEEALRDALTRVSVADFDRWHADLDACAGLHRGQPLGECLRKTPAAEHPGAGALPHHTAAALESGAGALLRDIRLRELGLLVSAFQHANGNRARAATLLKDATGGRVSTIHFDRWFHQLWKELDQAEHQRLRLAHPAVEQICRALGI